NDELESFSPSPDPLLEELQAFVADVKLDGSQQEIHEILKPILSNHQIFPNEMYQTGLAQKIENYFEQMLQGKGAVLNTLQNVLKEHGKNY
ncbi:MAG: mannitol dehydrogenase family protein, partial [Lactococcus lactis]